MHKHRSRLLRRLWRTCVFVVFAICLLGTFCFSPHDEAAFRTFTESVGRWQSNPEFRGIASEYCIDGSAAASSRFCWIPVRKIIMSIRSMPGLPARYAVSSTSRSHYENFSRGPLMAYLYLCSEQDLPNSIHFMETEAAKNDFSDTEMARYLGSFDMGFPVARDHGACRSLAATFAATDAARPFQIRENIAPLLLKPIGEIASELQIPTEAQSMTFDEQHAVLERLDGYLKSHDPELWRSKQINDSAAGVWAQAYGPPYAMLISPLLMFHDVCKVMSILLTALLAIRYWCKWRSAQTPIAAQLQPAESESH